MDQVLLVNSFSSDLLRKTLSSSKITAVEDVKQLLFKLDIDGNNQLDRNEVIEFLGLIELLTVGEPASEDVRGYLADYLFTTLDPNKNGVVDLKDLEYYISMNNR